MTQQIDTQFICATDPECVCSGEQFSCTCVREQNANVCADCQAPMVKINIDTGEAVEAA